MKLVKNMLLIAGVSVAGLALASCAGSGSSDGGSGGSADLPDFNPGNRLTMVIPMGPGGGSDISGRAIAAGLEEVTGKTISVENQEGGGGAVGYANFLAQAGDPSYMLASETALINLALTQDVPFHWKDFTPIMKLGQDSTIMVVPEKSSYDTCTDVTKAAAEKDVKVSVSGGVTGNDAIQFGLIEKAQDVSFQRVPYESGGEAIAAVLGGHVDVALTNPGEVLGQLESGDLKALCVIAEERYEYEELKDIPTTVEQGIDVTFAQYRSFIMPGGLSDEAKEYWVAAAKAYAETDAFEEYMTSNFMQTDPLYGDEFSKYLENYEAELKAGLEEK